MSWASPIRLDRAALGERQAVELVTSSPAAWTADSTQIAPDYRAHPEVGFATGEDTGRKTLAVAVEGSFESYFAGKPSPLAEAAAESAEGDDAGEGAGEGAEEEAGEEAERKSTRLNSSH